MPNFNTESGLAFGCISFNALADWCNDDLWYGDKAVDLSWQWAMEELKAEGERAYVNLLEEAGISAAESGADREPGFNLEDWEEKWFDHKNHEYDKEAFVEAYIERGRESIDISEPIIEGECGGVKYRITWLGGAPILYSFNGPTGVAVAGCSPCVPGAADLDSGFKLSEEMDPDHDYSHWVACHCVPRSWLRDQEDPQR